MKGRITKGSQSTRGRISKGTNCKRTQSLAVSHSWNELFQVALPKDRKLLRGTLPTKRNTKGLNPQLVRITKSTHYRRNVSTRVALPHQAQSHCQRNTLPNNSFCSWFALPKVRFTKDKYYPRVASP
jgi:hypothetical protein